MQRFALPARGFIAGVMLLCGVAHAPHVEATGKKSSFTPPAITATVICEDPFTWTLALQIVDDTEVAYFTIQPPNVFGLTSTVTAEPGQQLVEFNLTGNAVGRRLLILAADVEGNVAKEVVDVPNAHCGAQN